MIRDIRRENYNIPVTSYLDKTRAGECAKGNIVLRSDLRAKNGYASRLRPLHRES